MKERPILFSGPMVRAILEGRKTMTRRVVKPQPTKHVTDGTYDWMGSLRQVNMPIESILDACPYGVPGDRLWVRETWQTAREINSSRPSNFERWPVRYLADGKINMCGGFMTNVEGKTRVSIHMPRWASRITLEVTGVRVERLWEITAEDAKAEGTRITTETGHGLPVSIGVGYRAAFAHLWISINGRDSWEANPWVWVVEFERVKG